MRFSMEPSHRRCTEAHTTTEALLLPLQSEGSESKGMRKIQSPETRNIRIPVIINALASVHTNQNEREETL